ncbi:signal transduction histidine kinase [Kordia periserrulae]|uniref:histidine kinase n=1 Tax=Kordia periserrulae TaxID=701523 RepID=A0A2T6C725_9FLAO|nr:ATP-binding protein [Kordia periserrulae]PTX64102.1 signal transduction histidine kinase [Kordia periserrulae]
MLFVIKYRPNSLKYSPLWILLLYSFLTYGLNKNTAEFKDDNLQSNLLPTHQKKLNDNLEMLQKATTAIDSAKAYTNICFVYYSSAYYLKVPRYEDILQYSTKIIALTSNTQSDESLKLKLHALRFKGTVYKSLGDFSKALDFFNDIISKTEHTTNPDYFYHQRQAATTEIAEIFAFQKNYKLALSHYHSLFAYVEKNQIDVSKISSIVYLRCARFNRQAGNIDDALVYAYKAIATSVRNSMSVRTAMSYLELAHIYVDINSIANATLYLDKAHLILKEDKQYLSLLSKYHYLKAVIGKKNNNVSDKLYHAEKAFALLENEKLSDRQIATGNLLYDAYKEKGFFEKANLLLEKIVAIEKKMSNKEELKKTAFIEIQRRDKNIELAEAKSEKMNKIIFWIALLLAVGIFSMIYIYKDWKKKSKLAREIAKKNMQLEQLDKIKSNFFSNITHELQTPLTLIKGPLELALEENHKSLDASTKAKIQMAMNNTDSLKTMVNDMLDLSKLEAKELVLKRENVDLDTFLNTTMRKFTAIMKQKKLHFNYCFKDLESYTAIVDTKKLEKILNNLLSNAIKYTPANGTIKVCGKLEDEQLILTVKDTGIGIPATDIPHVFERYFQSNDASKPLEGGYGIGLSLVKELVEFMNGTIHVQSEVKKGSQFVVKLPLENVDTNKHQSSQVDEIKPSVDTFASMLQHMDKTLKEHTILIVEDHRDMQQFIASILQKEYRVLLVNNGKEAMDKLQNTAVDLIVSDVMMPAMDGFTLLETLKASEVYCNIPVIMLTALSDIKYKIKALTFGVDDYLSKPFVAAELLARVYNLLMRSESRKQFLEESTQTVEHEEEVSEAFTEQLTTIAEEKAIIKKSDKLLIDKVAEIIAQNIDNPDFKLTDLTEKVYVSERQLRRKIKLITGLSPKKFQQEIQLLKARTLLEEDTYSNVKAVAISVGIHNSTRFSKLYIERFGKHPATYFTASS